MTRARGEADRRGERLAKDAVRQVARRIVPPNVEAHVHAMLWPGRCVRAAAAGDDAPVTGRDVGGRHLDADGKVVARPAPASAQFEKVAAAEARDLRQPLLGEDSGRRGPCWAWRVAPLRLLRVWRRARCACI